MPKNLVKNHFESAGIYVEGERSVFNFNKPVLSSFMSGMLVPLGDPIPVFPGVKLDLSIDAVLRSNTMVVPPLDGIFVDFFAVWVPHRIVWNHMPQFLGENDTTAWTQSNSYIYPYVTYYQINDYSSGFGYLLVMGEVTDDSTMLGNFSLFDKYGLLNPNYMSREASADLAASSVKINVLAARGYYSIWNYLFRDENYQRPVLFSKGDTGSAGEFGYFIRQDYLISSSVNLIDEFGSSTFGCNKAILMPVNKLHDAFTSVLPQAQFGDAVTLPLGTSANIVMDAPTSITYSAGTSFTPYNLENITSTNRDSVIGLKDANNKYSALYADLSTATAATINQFRTAVMYQRYLEAIARSGRRTPEYYNAIYGVKNSAAAHDYPELLTRSRYMLNVNQVIATADGSGDGWTSHLGDTGAYSLTVLRNIPCCEKDFDEFGYLHILYCVRADNRYSSMIPQHFTRSSLLDEYNPFFDHIGDVQVPNYIVNSNVENIGNFGFQEAWWDERTQLSMATGALNKDYGSLKYWILGESFDSSVEVCTPEFLTFNPAIFNDVFVSAYYAYPQFIIDARIKGKKIARMSQHSIPGIVGRI